MVTAIGEFGLTQFLIVLTVNLTTIITTYTMLMTSQLFIIEPDWWLMTSYRNLTLKQFKQCPHNTAVVSINQLIVFDESTDTFVSEWNLICDKSWIPSTIKTTYSVSVILGALIVGQLSDWFGRRECLVDTYCIALCCVLVQSFATNWYTALLLAVPGGFGVGGYLVCSKIYCLEFVGTTWRTAVASLPSQGK